MIVLLLLGTVNAACVNLRPRPRPIAPELAGDAPSPVWTARAGRGLSAPMVLDGSTVYVGGVDRKVYAVDLDSGAVRWSSRLAGMVLGGVRISGDTVFAASARPQGRVYALDRGTGKELWKSDAGAIAAPLTLVGDAVVALTIEGEAVSFDRRNGDERWRRRVGAARTAAVPVGRGSLLVATTDSLLRLELAGGRVTHRVRSPGVVVSAWVPWHRLLLAGSTDSQVIALRPSDLSVAWSVRVDAPVLSPPVPRGDSLFVVSRVGSLFVIPPLGSEPPAAVRVATLRWPVTAPLAVDGGEILLGGADGVIRALRANGTERWRVRVWRPVELAPLPLPDGLLAVGGNGDLHRYRR